MTGAPQQPIVPPRPHVPAARIPEGAIRPQHALHEPGGPAAGHDAGTGPAAGGGAPGVGLRVFCGVVAAFAALMFATLVVLGLKAADRAIRESGWGTKISSL